jgi:small ligand-binding sensory domain FIST
MKRHEAVATEISAPYSAAAAVHAAEEIRRSLGRPARVAFTFVSPDYIPHLGELCEILRVDGHITDVVGCTAGGRIFGDRGIESGSGCAVLALDCDAEDPVMISDGEAPQFEFDPNAFVALINPFETQADEWIQGWNASFPKVPCVGGLASGGDEDQVAVFLNGETGPGVVLPLKGATTILPVVSQGCRPIGEPLTVTRAEHNVLYALGGQPAYHALESAFQSLSDSEKSNARGNLFAGIAGTEYIDDFKPGDFLIRNIIGADPDSGAVVIGAIPRIGQTLQYQLRDRSVAQEDLARALSAGRIPGRRPFASLVFSCLGRGEKFFGSSGHDAGQIFESTKGKSSIGFFGNGEIGPVAGRNALHTYTASAAIWVEKEL